jgi:hypothetical protein
LDEKKLVPLSVKVEFAVMVFASIELPPNVEKKIPPVTIAEPDNVETTSVLP